MTDTIQFPPIGNQSPRASEMLKEIAKQDPNHAFVICWGKDGLEPTFHSSTEDMPVILLRLQTFIHKYFNGDFKPNEK